MNVTLGTRLISKKIFLSEPANFLLQTNLEEIFQLSKMVWKKLLLFHGWDLKLVPIDSVLNSVSGNLTHFFQKCRRGIKKSSQT